MKFTVYTSDLPSYFFDDNKTQDNTWDALNM